MICPGQMRFGLVICGFAASRVARVTPNRLAMAVTVQHARPTSARTEVAATAEVVMICPGKMRFGSVICGFAASRVARVTPNLAAMALNVSPEWTIYFAIIGCLLDGAAPVSRWRGASGDWYLDSAIGRVAWRAKV